MELTRWIHNPQTNGQIKYATASRMTDERWTETIMNSKPTTKRDEGRPTQNDGRIPSDY